MRSYIFTIVLTKHVLLGKRERKKRDKRVEVAGDDENLSRDKKVYCREMTRSNDR